VSIAEIEATELALDTATGGLWHDALRRLIRNPAAILGFVLVGFFVGAALFAPVLAHGGPKDQNLSLIVAGCCPGPSHAHWLGVDQLGRDVYTRILYGARYSLLIGIVSVTIGLSIGLLDGTTIYDGDTGGRWQIGYTSQIRATLEKTLQRDVAIGISAGYATAPLTYTAITPTGSCGIGSMRRIAIRCLR
jgi:hypothetical protein